MQLYSYTTSHNYLLSCPKSSKNSCINSSNLIYLLLNGIRVNNILTVYRLI